MTGARQIDPTYLSEVRGFGLSDPDFENRVGISIETMKLQMEAGIWGRLWRAIEKYPIEVFLALEREEFDDKLIGDLVAVSPPRIIESLSQYMEWRRSYGTEFITNGVSVH